MGYSYGVDIEKRGYNNLVQDFHELIESIISEEEGWEKKCRGFVDSCFLSLCSGNKYFQDIYELWKDYSIFSKNPNKEVPSTELIAKTERILCMFKRSIHEKEEKNKQIEREDREAKRRAIQIEDMLQDEIYRRRVMEINERAKIAERIRVQRYGLMGGALTNRLFK